MSFKETILVYPRSVLDNIGSFQGVNFDYKKYVDKILSPDTARFTPRDEAEFDSTKKQIIPYVILECNHRILFYVRGKKSGEARLRSKGSIGFGGHIKLEDDSMFHDTSSSLWDIYHAAEKREVCEELIIDSDYEDKIIAVLNDDSDDVGRVHFGIVHLWKLSEPRVRKKEQQITQINFLSSEEILALDIELEGWSRLCINNIDEILTHGGI